MYNDNFMSTYTFYYHQTQLLHKSSNLPSDYVIIIAFVSNITDIIVTVTVIKIIIYVKWTHWSQSNPQIEENCIDRLFFDT